MRGEIPRVRSTTVISVYCTNDNTSINQIPKLATLCQQQLKHGGIARNVLVYGWEQTRNAKTDLVDLDPDANSLANCQILDRD